MDESWLLFFFVGLLAQLVDGALGMAFGVTATTVMLSFGTAPAQASAMVHIAEIFTTAASGASHWWHRNVDWSIVRRIAIPGTIGGILGATLLSNVDGNVIAPFVTVYLALMGVLILARAIRKFTTVVPTQRGMLVVGFSGGVLDAVGGGGWGPIVTSTLVGAGHVPRYVVGSVNLTEFFVTFATSATFIVTLGGVPKKWIFLAPTPRSVAFSSFQRLFEFLNLNRNLVLAARVGKHLLVRSQV